MTILKGGIFVVDDKEVEEMQSHSFWDDSLDIPNGFIKFLAEQNYTPIGMCRGIAIKGGDVLVVKKK